MTNGDALHPIRALCGKPVVMASRESVLRRLRRTLADELVVLIRRCGLLVHVMLATLLYKHLLQECLPGQYALAILFALYGVGVIKLFPGATSPHGIAKWFAIAGRFIATQTMESNPAGNPGRDRGPGIAPRASQDS